MAGYVAWRSGALHRFLAILRVIRPNERHNPIVTRRTGQPDCRR